MLLWVDGFDAYGTSTGSAPAPTGVLARKYTTVTYESSYHVHAGRLGGYCLEFNTSAEYFTSPPLTTDATMILGLALKTPSWPSNGTLITFLDGSTKGMNVRVTIGGELAVYLGDSLIATTSGCGLTQNNWYYIEFKVVCGSSGSYDLRIGGNSVLSNGSVNTKAGSHDYHTAFRIGETSATQIYFVVDDLYCADGATGAVTNFLGNQRVVTIFPNGDVGGYTDFTPSAVADHNTLVDENPVNDDTDYVESSTTGHTDLWDYGAVADLGPIAGIQINTQARETDATTFSLQTVIKSDVTVDPDAGQVIGSTNYKSLRRVSEADPHAAPGTAWTATTLSAAQFGVKVG